NRSGEAGRWVAFHRGVDGVGQRAAVDGEMDRTTDAVVAEWRAVEQQAAREDFAGVGLFQHDVTEVRGARPQERGDVLEVRVVRAGVLERHLFEEVFLR